MKRFNILIYIFLIYFICSCTNESSQHNIIPVKIGTKWGYVSNIGQLIISPKFKNVRLGVSGSFYSDGLAIIEENYGQIGFIDKTGNFKIAPKYLSATPFKEEKAIVVESEKYPIVIDINGNTLFELKDCDEVHQFSENLAVIVKNNLYGYIDNYGNITISPQFKTAYKFENGSASVQSNLNDKKFGIININGQYIIEPTYEATSSFDKQGYARVKLENKWGLINKENKFIINPRFDWLGSFDNELALVKIENKFGFITIDGRYRINPQFLIADEFKSNYTVVQTIDSLWGIIDKDGKYLISPKYNQLSILNGDNIFFKKDSLWGIVDLKDNIILPPQFNNIGFDRYSDFVEPIAISDFIDVESISSFLLRDFNDLFNNEFSIKAYIKNHFFNSKDEYKEYIDAIVRKESMNLGHNISMSNYFKFNGHKLDYIQYEVSFGLFKEQFAKRVLNRLTTILLEKYPNTQTEDKLDIKIIKTDYNVFAMKTILDENTLNGILIFQIKYL